MSNNICLFEDDNFEDLYPLSLTRPLYEIRLGMMSLRERLERLYPQGELFLLCREYLAEYLKNSLPQAKVMEVERLKREGALLINGRALPSSKKLSGDIPIKGEEELGLKGDIPVYARLSGEKIKALGELNIIPKSELLKLKGKIKTKDIEIELINYPWDLIRLNGKTLIEDFSSCPGQAGISGYLDERAVLYGEKARLHLSKESRVEAGVIINLEDGPVYIGEKAKVRPPTIIDGPCYIGPGTIIDGAKIRSETSIGQVCRIGGEVEASIIHGYTNKHHDGFLGHAYLGEWVNLGAMATNSDLKNNYGDVRVYVRGEFRKSGEIKLGSFIGDYSKLGIGTLLNTGAVVGVGCNIFGGGTIPPKFIPSFCWGDGKEFAEYALERCIKDAETIMGRRKIKQSEAHRKIMRYVHEITEPERKKVIAGHEQAI